MTETTKALKEQEAILVPKKALKRAERILKEQGLLKPAMTWDEIIVTLIEFHD